MVLALAPVALCMTPVVSKGTLWEAVAPRRGWGDTRPNLILITIDALRADHLGAYGDQRGLTPALDAFAKEGTLYESAYATAPWTLSSLGSLFTMVPPSRCGLKAPPDASEVAGSSADWYWRHAVLTPDTPLLSEYLHDAGYTTAAELTSPFLTPRYGWGRGFAFSHYEPGSSGPNWRAGGVKPRGDQVTASSLAWVSLHHREPFFLWVHYMDPHMPYEAPTTPVELRRRYEALEPVDRASWGAHRRTLSGPELRTYRDLTRAMYAEQVKYADSSVKTLLHGLKRAGLWDRSLIVITADHGEELLDHGGIDHGDTMYNELLAVPLMVKWPQGTAADERVAQTVALPSVGMTLLRAAGIPPPANTLVHPLPTRTALGGGNAVYSEARFGGPDETALTTDQWRIIYHPEEQSPEKQFEVYDRRRDSAEQHDVAATGAAADLREQLRKLTEAADQAASRRAAALPHESDRSPLTPEAERQLRALGYVR
jgi:arylsulfatase A-like enzyme